MLPTVVLAFNKPIHLAPSAAVVDFGDRIDNISTACVLLRTSRMTYLSESGRLLGAPMPAPTGWCSIGR
jgi:hypothetical protein